ncbi:hypothetical protein MED121_02205 [Marinomonas sp. MED121]|uniref:phage tail tape measure protein n=1 Tax=Marinomonas sp. MED121 TaxID=314277 RepID=UPI0000690B04|nr:phage tail tape measure protein [Marinomonas sp. MED121]EAQ65986.1 hypothetical protein MED121_02205 [Marinomonas sp. MED121]
MGQKLETDIVINLAGNLAAKAKSYGGSMSEFARNNKRAMNMIRSSANAAGRGIDSLGNRYVGLAAATTSGFALNKYRNLDRELSRLAISADITREKSLQLWEEIQESSSEFKVDPRQSLTAIQEIMTKIGDLDYAMKNKRNIPLVIQATGATGDAVGGIFTEFKKLNIDTQEKAMAAIDTINVQGKSGAFPLAGMAQFGPEIFAAYAATGRQGVDAVREIGAALQVIREGVGTDSEAVTSYTALLRDITRPQTTKTLKGVGIDVFDPKYLKEGKEVMRSLPQIMEEIIVKSSGLSENLAMLNLSDEGKKSLNTLITELKNTGDVQGFDKFLKITGDGSQTMKDASVAASDFDASLQSISNGVSRFANDELAGPLQDIADAINGVDQETIQNWLKWGEASVYAIGTVVAAKKALDAGMWAKKTFGAGGVLGNKGKGGLNSLGATPVYVVNMGQGGMGGADLPDKTNGGSRSSKGKGITGALGRSATIFSSTVYSSSLNEGEDEEVAKWRESGYPQPFVQSSESLKDAKQYQKSISELIEPIISQDYAAQIFQNINKPLSQAPSAFEGNIGLDLNVYDHRIESKVRSKSPFLTINSDPDAGPN